ncbi:MAG TPA: hypothetical protein VFE24_06690, partial [Pirellulales bacterium]|nr:hypothetical protein [Pirellulales bacterium]
PRGAQHRLAGRQCGKMPHVRRIANIKVQAASSRFREAAGICHKKCVGRKLPRERYASAGKFHAARNTD